MSGPPDMTTGEQSLNTGELHKRRIAPISSCHMFALSCRARPRTTPVRTALESGERANAHARERTRARDPIGISGREVGDTLMKLRARDGRLELPAKVHTRGTCVGGLFAE